jgi:hypothetical protein
MKIRTLLLINTAVAGVFGLGLVVAPAHVTAMYGITADAGLQYMGQLFGSCLVGIAALCWFAKDAPASEASIAIFRALFVFNGVAFVVALVAQLKGVTNAVGWSAVAIFLLFALGWMYVLRSKPTA